MRNDAPYFPVGVNSIKGSRGLLINYETWQPGDTIKVAIVQDVDSTTPGSPYYDPNYQENFKKFLPIVRKGIMNVVDAAPGVNVQFVTAADRANVVFALANKTGGAADVDTVKTLKPVNGYTRSFIGYKSLTERPGFPKRLIRGTIEEQILGVSMHEMGHMMFLAHEHYNTVDSPLNDQAVMDVDLPAYRKSGIRPGKGKHGILPKFRMEMMTDPITPANYKRRAQELNKYNLDKNALSLTQSEKSVLSQLGFPEPQNDAETLLLATWAEMAPSDGKTAIIKNNVIENTSYDEKSLMGYSIPSEFTLDNRDILENMVLSDGDKEMLRVLYPIRKEKIYHHYNKMQEYTCRTRFTTGTDDIAMPSVNTCDRGVSTRNTPWAVGDTIYITIFPRENAQNKYTQEFKSNYMRVREGITRMARMAPGINIQFVNPDAAAHYRIELVEEITTSDLPLNYKKTMFTNGSNGSIGTASGDADKIIGDASHQFGHALGLGHELYNYRDNSVVDYAKVKAEFMNSYERGDTKMLENTLITYPPLDPLKILLGKNITNVEGSPNYPQFSDAVANLKNTFVLEKDVFAAMTGVNADEYTAFAHLLGDIQNSQDLILLGNFDKDSIMLYNVPGKFTKTGHSFVSPVVPSAKDNEILNQMYPSGPKKQVIKDTSDVGNNIPTDQPTTPVPPTLVVNPDVKPVVVNPIIIQQPIRPGIIENTQSTIPQTISPETMSPVISTETMSPVQQQPIPVETLILETEETTSPTDGIFGFLKDDTAKWIFGISVALVLGFLTWFFIFRKTVSSKTSATLIQSVPQNQSSLNPPNQSSLNPPIQSSLNPPIQSSFNRPNMY